MSAAELLAKRFEELVTEGDAMIQGYQCGEGNPQENYLRFRASALNLVNRACGIKSDHYTELKRLAESKDTATNPYYLQHCVGALKAAKDDFDRGLLIDIRALIAAEILGDFTSQAEALFEAGYHVPAASLAGAVLEDTLRKLCEKFGVAIPEPSKLNSLNAELARADAYSKLVQKQITAWADLRNDADHGKFDRVKRDDVEAMIKWVRRFASEELN